MLSTCCALNGPSGSDRLRVAISSGPSVFVDLRVPAIKHNVNGYSTYHICFADRGLPMITNLVDGPKYSLLLSEDKSKFFLEASYSVELGTPRGFALLTAVCL
jgi:hypothetical protein